MLPAGKHSAGLQESPALQVLPLFSGRALPVDLRCTQPMRP